MNIILAKKILPVTSPPISNGAIALNGRTIVAVGKKTTLLRRFPSADVIDLGRLLVMPGLVNTHAHLDLSHLKGKLGEHTDFFDWITALIEARKRIGEKGLVKAASVAIGQAVRTGTTCIGDISSTEKAVPALRKSGLRAVVFLEVIGLDPAASQTSMRRLKDRMAALGSMPDRLSAGISPHSPYSVSSSLYKLLREYISDSCLTFAVHLSESIDEYHHIRGNASGMDRYMAYTGWDRHSPNRAESPLKFLKEVGVHNGLLAVHAVHLDKNDMVLLASSGASVAHCPRSNHMLGVGRAPVKELMERGVNVALGTDSLTSSMDIDMWEEMRFAYLVNGLRAEQVMRMATINGAKALHLDSVTGSLEPGKEADLIAVRTDSVTADDPCRGLLYNTRAGDVMLSMVQGKTIYKSDELKGRHGL